jgi:hypothetical protein
MSTISASLKIELAVTETLTTAESPLIDSGDSTVKEKISVSKTLSASSTPDGELHAAMQIAMTAGAATIDFTALTRHGGGAVSFNGKIVRCVVFENPATNANSITIAEGAANGLALLGAAFSIILKPGHSIGINLDDDGPTVGAADKNVDITGTASQVLNMVAVAG